MSPLARFFRTVYWAIGIALALLAFVVGVAWHSDSRHDKRRHHHSE